MTPQQFGIGFCITVIVLAAIVKVCDWRTKATKPNKRKPQVLPKPRKDERSSIEQHHRIIGRLT